MTKKRHLLLIITTVLLLASIITTTVASALGSAGELGESPYINKLGSNIKVDSSQFYDGTVIQK